MFRCSKNGGTGGSGVIECDRAVGGEQGCSDGSGSMSHRFSAAAHGLEKGGVGDLVVVDRCINSDLVVRLGDSGGTGDRGMGCRELRGIRELLGLRWGWWSGSFEWMMCSDERVCM
jgi:hypothetical protein